MSLTKSEMRHAVGMPNPIRAIAVLLLAIGLSAADANLLANPGLTLADGKLAGWKTPDGSGTAETTGLPDGVASAIALKIDAAGNGGSSQILQRLSIGDHGVKWRAAAWTKASAKGVAYVQVKLFGPDKKELKRIAVGDAGGEWKRIEKDIDATGAAEIELLLRWNRSDKTIGQTAWFAAPFLAPAP